MSVSLDKEKCCVSLQTGPLYGYSVQHTSVNQKTQADNITSSKKN